MAYTFLLRNTPALASCSNSANLISCRLYIKYSSQYSQAAIIVSLSAYTHTSDNPQTFDLVYNADNLTAGTCLGPPPGELTSDQLSSIARRTNATAFKALSLMLNAPCSIRCAPSTGCIAPKPGHAAAFRRLRDLASTTKVYVVFDHNWVLDEHYAALYSLINRPDRLAGIPASFYQGILSREVDWTVFGPVHDDQPEEPPRYERVSAKRPQAISASSSPVQPLSKRKRAMSLKPDADPMEPLSPDWGSPTEKATTTTESSWPSPLHLLSPHPRASSPREASKAMLETLLPDALEKLMPDLLARTFAVSISSEPHATASIGSLISAHIASDVESRLALLHAKTIEESCTNTVKQMSGDFITRILSDKLKEVFEDVLDKGYDIRNNAEATFFEELEDCKVDVTIAKDNGLEEIRRELDEKREGLIATAEEVVSRSGADVQRLADRSWDSVRLAIKVSENLLSQIRTAVAHEQSEGGRMRRPTTTESSHRATSLPP